MKFGITKEGGLATADGVEHAGLDSLGVYSAISGLGKNLRDVLKANQSGSLRGVIIAMSAEHFAALRSALAGADEFSQQLVRGCGHGAQGRDRMMIAGIEIYRAEDEH